MTKMSVRSLLGVVAGLGLVALGAVPAARSAATAVTTSATAPPYNCSPNGPAGSQTVYGTFGDASVIGWEGNSQAVVACLGGSFWVDTSGPNGGPGSASTAAVTGTTYGYGVYDDSPTTWTNADGYLPALVTTFHRDGATISITNFGDDVSIGGHALGEPAVPQPGLAVDRNPPRGRERLVSARLGHRQRQHGAA